MLMGYSISMGLIFTGSCRLVQQRISASINQMLRDVVLAGRAIFVHFMKMLRLHKKAEKRHRIPGLLCRYFTRSRVLPEVRGSRRCFGACTWR
jgi:hypothetical protein